MAHQYHVRAPTTYARVHRTLEYELFNASNKGLPAYGTPREAGPGGFLAGWIDECVLLAGGRPVPREMSVPG